MAITSFDVKILLPMTLALVTFEVTFSSTVYYHFEEVVALKDKQNIVDSVVLSSRAGLSALDCSRQCVKNRSCVSFIFNKDIQKCQLLNTVLFVNDTQNVTGWKYYSRSSCSASGYQLVSNLCLKIYHQSASSFSTAQELCELDGGRLLRIKSAHDQETMKNYLENFSDPSVLPFIDGKRQDVNFTWTDGTVIPYEHWEAGFPTEAKNCIKVVPDVDYKWKSALCFSNRQFICEIIV